MKTIQVDNFQELMANGNCEIVCPIKDEVVRTLTVKDGVIHLIAGDGTELDINLNTPITYEPWFFDRCSMLFEHEGTTLKLCTERDTLRTENGNYAIAPKVPDMLETS